MVLLQYAKTDGRICGVFRSTSPELLEGQAHAANDTYGYVLAATDDTNDVLQTRWWIEDETLVAKTAVRLTATPNPFVAVGQVRAGSRLPFSSLYGCAGG